MLASNVKSIENWSKISNLSPISIDIVINKSLKQTRQKCKNNEKYSFPPHYFQNKYLSKSIKMFLKKKSLKRSFGFPLIRSIFEKQLTSGLDFLAIWALKSITYTYFDVCPIGKHLRIEFRQYYSSYLIKKHTCDGHKSIFNWVWIENVCSRTRKLRWAG